jgi:hypothetical protein
LNLKSFAAIAIPHGGMASVNQAFAGSDARVTDTAILGERWGSASGMHANFFPIALENQSIARTNAKYPTHLARNGNLSLASDLCFSLHAGSLLFCVFPYRTAFTQ